MLPSLLNQGKEYGVLQMTLMPDAIAVISQMFLNLCHFIEQDLEIVVGSITEPIDFVRLEAFETKGLASGANAGFQYVPFFGTWTAATPTSKLRDNSFTCSWQLNHSSCCAVPPAGGIDRIDIKQRAKCYGSQCRQYRRHASACLTRSYAHSHFSSSVST